MLFILNVNSALLKVDMDALRLVSEESLEQNKKWKEDILDQNVCP